MNWCVILLVAGTSIGAAALPLPIFLAPYGLVGACILLTLVWAVMWGISALVLEVLSAFDQEVSYVTMADATLGSWGRRLTSLAYIFLLYALIAAYLSGLGGLMSQYVALDQSMISCILAGLGGVSLGLGVRVLDGFNRVFSIMLLASFVALFVFGAQHLPSFHWLSMHGHGMMHALPIAMLAFGYQVVIPSIYHLAHRRPKETIRAITIGSFIPLILYVLWVGEVFSLLPTGGVWGLDQLMHQGDPAKSLVISMSHVLSSHWVVQVVACLIFSAMATSFFGIALSLYDMWADALVLKAEGLNRWFYATLSMMPGLLFALMYPEGFMLALKYAAIFVALLSGFLPIAMAWVVRRRRVKRQYVAPISNVGIVLLCLFFMLVVGVCL